MATAFVNRRQVLSLAAMPFVNVNGEPKCEAIPSAPRFSRGINFHHVLNWPALRAGTQGTEYDWPPFGEDKYKLRVEDLALVRSLGFDFIRLTVDPGLWIFERAEHAADLEGRYLNCLNAILGAGFNVVFDLAPVNNHPDFTPDRITSSLDSKIASDYANMVERAARLLSKAPRDRIALELFNEPPLIGALGEAKWATWQVRLHSRARDVAPDLPLVLTAANWGDGDALTRLDVSEYTGSNVIYTFHYYKPHIFTHQGMKSGGNTYVAGLDWPTSNLQAEACAAAATQNVLDDKGISEQTSAKYLGEIRHSFSELLKNVHDEGSVAQDFDAICAWAGSNAIDSRRILLGEFGCAIASRGRPLGLSRLRWLSAVRHAAEAHGFGWAYWALKGFGGMELLDQKGDLHADLIAPLGLEAPP